MVNSLINREVFDINISNQILGITNNAIINECVPARNSFICIFSCAFVRQIIFIGCDVGWLVVF